MVTHRRLPGGGVAAPAGWFIVLSVVACAGAAGWLGFLLVGPGSASAEDAQAARTPSAPATSAPAATTPEPTVAPTTPEPVPTPTKTPVERTASVAVLNNTGIGNLARAYSAKVSGAGWTVSALGNWRGQIVSNTVYYPGSLKDQAELLAADVGITRVLPSVAPMQTDRLTIILSGPQQ